MATKINPPIEKHLQAMGRSVRFDTLESLQDWAKRQRAAWPDIDGKALQRLPQVFKEALQPQLQASETLLTLVEQAKSHAEDESLGGMRPKIEGQLNLFSTGECLLAETPEAKHVAALLDTDLSHGAATLRALQNRPLELSNQVIRQNGASVVKGVVEAHVISKGISGNLQAEREALEELRVDFHEKTESARKEFSDITDSHVEWKEKLESLHNQQDVAFNDLTEKATGRLEALETLFKEKLRLRAPVSYWQRKKWAHLAATVISGAIFVGVVGLLFYELGGHVQQIKTYLAPVAGEGGKLALSAPALLILAVVPSFLVLWVLKLISRVFISNLALQADASERVAMTNTFLALMEEDEKVKEEDRILILQALFRPSASHAGQDDGAPAHWFDLLLNRIDKTR